MRFFHPKQPGQNHSASCFSTFSSIFIASFSRKCQGKTRKTPNFQQAFSFYFINYAYVFLFNRFFTKQSENSISIFLQYDIIINLTKKWCRCLQRHHFLSFFRQEAAYHNVTVHQICFFPCALNSKRTAHQIHKCDFFGAAGDFFHIFRLFLCFQILEELLSFSIIKSE